MRVCISAIDSPPGNRARDGATLHGLPEVGLREVGRSGRRSTRRSRPRSRPGGRAPRARGAGRRLPAVWRRALDRAGVDDRGRAAPRGAPPGPWPARAPRRRGRSPVRDPRASARSARSRRGGRAPAAARARAGSVGVGRRRAPMVGRRIGRSPPPNRTGRADILGAVTDQPISLSPQGPPETVLDPEPADAQARLARGARAPRRRPPGHGGRHRRRLAPLPRRLGPARRARPRPGRGVRLLPGGLPPRARPAAPVRLARLGLRALGARDQPGVPPGARRPAGQRRDHRRDRRGVALRRVPPPARAGVGPHRPLGHDHDRRGGRGA